MKALYSFIVIMIFSSAVGFSQWTDVINSNINYEFRINYNYYGGGNDTFDNAEPVMRTEFWNSDSNEWLYEQCYATSCDGACYFGGNPAWWSGTNKSFGVEWSAYLLAYESDNSDECSWYDDDDYAWQGQCSLIGGATQQRVVMESTSFRPCAWNEYLAGGTGWLYPNTAIWDQIMAETWRYNHGDSAPDPLQFGTISSGAKSDINANRSVEQSSSTQLSYSDTAGQSSADVWYSFSLSESKTVTISTDHAETDFDTYLRLRYQNGGDITSDDDSGANNTSVISRALCAGDYLIAVEGFSTLTGLYKLSVTVEDAPYIVSTITEVSASCLDAEDGSASWNVTGGVPPFTYAVDGNNAGTSINNLGLGQYQLVFTDACGTSNTAGIFIGLDDQINPTALCANNYEYVAIEGQSTPIDTDQVDAGSYDNCAGDVSFQTDPEYFSPEDAGFTEVTLIVSDESGNFSTCVTTTFVSVGVGVDELSEISEFSIYPNPNHGTFTLDVSALKLSNKANYTILDMTGRTIKANQINSPLETINFEDAAEGIYFIRLNDGNSSSTSRFEVLK